MNLNEQSTQTLGIQWPRPREAAHEHPVNSGKNGLNDTRENLSLDQVSLEGKALRIGKLLQKRKRAPESRKITIYLSKQLCSAIYLLKHQNIIDSFSKTIEDALILYLTSTKD